MNAKRSLSSSLTTWLNSANGFESWPMSLAGVTGDRRRPARPGPISSQTAVITSTRKRARFSIEPP
jgi:hypothetical protein